MPTPCYEKLVYGPTAGDAVPDTTTNAYIPLTGSHRLSSQVVYGDDEVQILYIENTLDVEAVIYAEVATTAISSVEAEVARLRGILATPGLQLRLHPAGLGEILTINHSQAEVKGGPFPQSIVVEPVASNNAILVRWTILFRTVDCPSPLNIPLLQYNVEQDMDIDDEGNMKFTVNISYQAKDPITDITSISNIADILVASAGRSFQGFRKEKRVSFSRDQRIVSIRLVYKEVESENALYPTTSDIQVNDSVESEIMGKSILGAKGFYSWRRNISGTIKLPPRIHKAYAWVIFLKILRSRFKKLYPFSKVAAILGTKGNNNQDNSEEAEPYYLPTRIKITNALYSRSLKFEVSYLVTSSMDLLLHNTKIFSRINTTFIGAEEETEPLAISDQWKLWNDSRQGNRLNGIYQYDMNGTPIVYNQCTGAYTDHQFTPKALLQGEDDPNWDTGEDGSGGRPYEPTPDELVDAAAYPEKVYGDDLEASKSWLKYDNDFEIVEDIKGIVVEYLEEPPEDYYTSDVAKGNVSDRVTDGMILHGKTEPVYGQKYPAKFIRRGHASFYIRMKGYAMRIKHKISFPFITSVGYPDQNIAQRISSKTSQKQVSTGDIPIYMAKWDILYFMEGKDIYPKTDGTNVAGDIMPTIATTGDPAHYS